MRSQNEVLEERLNLKLQSSLETQKVSNEQRFKKIDDDLYNLRKKVDDLERVKSHQSFNQIEDPPVTLKEYYLKLIR